MKTIFDLPEDLVEDEIISRMSMTSLRSVRSTCKSWNALCKNRIVYGKAKKLFLMMLDTWKICLMNLDLSKDDGEPSIREASVLDQIKITIKVFDCDGLLLCLLKDCSRLVVWNPYLGQTRWIESTKKFHYIDTFALGYEHNNNLNHKILRTFVEIPPVTRRYVSGFELYDFTSSSWKVILDDVTPDWKIWDHHLPNVSLKGNAYFPVQKIVTEEGRSVVGFLLCFDFTTERFGPLLPLPFRYRPGGFTVSFSCVREEQQIAVLYQHTDALDTIEISVTDKIGPDVVSWTKFLKVVPSICVSYSHRSFFIDVEKNLAVVFILERDCGCLYQTAHVIRQDGCFKSVRIRKAPDLVGVFYGPTLVCSSYLPSLLQVQSNQPG